MKIVANGKEVKLTGETIIPCKTCRRYLWANEYGALSCGYCSFLSPAAIAKREMLNKKFGPNAHVKEGN